MNYKYMNLAIEESIKASKCDEVPIGAVLVLGKDEVIYRGHNNRNETKSVLGHAEIVVINKACSNLSRFHLDDCVLYVTMKPCNMCMEVIREAGIKEVFYLADPLDIKKNRYLKAVELTRIDNEDDLIKYKSILSEFFVSKR